MHRKPLSAPPPSPQDRSEVVDSLRHPLALRIRELLNRSERVQLDRILIDDEENILEALRSGVRIEALFHAGERGVSAALRDQLPQRVAVHEVARRTCKKLFDNEKISRIFAIAEAPPVRDLACLAETARDVIILEDVSISGNVGAIIRTSLALGAGAVVMLNASPADVYDRRLIRASRGFVFALPVVTASTEALLHHLRTQDLRLLAMSSRAVAPVTEVASIPHRLAIAFGSEKRGCSEQLLNAATLHVRIPTDPRVESLNVSASASIALFQRHAFNRLAHGRSEPPGASGTPPGDVDIG